MKKLVINLPHREDRKNKFLENGLTDVQFMEAVNGKKVHYDKMLSIGYNTLGGWRDPFHNRKITKGEIGCFLSHYNAWQECIRQNTPVIIFEDDAVVSDEFDEFEITKYLGKYNFLYLQRNENEPTKTESIDDKLEKPFYPYNLTAYAITPEAAKILCSTKILQSIVPADEYVPKALQNLKELNPAAYKKDIVTQLSRNDYGSDIEPYSDDDWFIDFKVHALTVGTDRKRCIPVNDSGAHFGIYPKNLGTNVDWFNDMTGPAGGKKITLLKEYIKDIPNRDVILFTDAYDVFYADDIETIVGRYLSFNARGVWSAERHCYPNPDLADKYPYNESPYRYLNSGTFICEVGELKKILDEDVKEEDDDQLFYTQRFLQKQFNMKLDYEQYIFQTHDEAVEKRGSQLYNPNTKCYGCIYHGNGGESSKDKFDTLYKMFYPKTPEIFLPKRSKYVDYMDRDMMVVDFMTQSQCEDLIAAGDKHGGWTPHPDDKFPAQEIRLKELGFWDECEKQWENYIYPIVEEEWSPMMMYGLREAFIMRYAMDTQTTLNNHCDASMVTGSVKLNDDYEGATLIFGRQKVSNIDIPVGKCILFPGQVTHGHYVDELKSGVKYSLTMWTSRYKGDLL